MSPSGCGCSDAPVETETDAVEVPGTTDEDAGQPGCAVDEDCPFGDVCEDGACRPSGPALDDEAAGATPTARRARAARSRPAAASTR